MANSHHRKILKARAVFAALSLLTLAVLACTMDLGSGGNAPDETEISISVNQTLAAEGTLTAQAKQALESPAPTDIATEDPGIQQTIQAQQATLDAQSTLISQPSPSTPLSQETVAATSPTPASMEPISLTDWDPINMRQAPGCGLDHNGPPCWFGEGENLTLTLEKPLLIDPTWSNPYLVFSHRYVFIHPATIYAKADGGWEVLWSYPAGQSNPWVPFQVDLSKYKGKEILIQMTATGSTTTASGKLRANTWNIRDPQIVPDYSPY